MNKQHLTQLDGSMLDNEQLELRINRKQAYFACTIFAFFFIVWAYLLTTTFTKNNFTQSTLHIKKHKPKSFDSLNPAQKTVICLAVLIFIINQLISTLYSLRQGYIIRMTHRGFFLSDNNFYPWEDVNNIYSWPKPIWIFNQPRIVVIELNKPSRKTTLRGFDISPKEAHEIIVSYWCHYLSEHQDNNKIIQQNK